MFIIIIIIIFVFFLSLEYTDNYIYTYGNVYRQTPVREKTEQWTQFEWDTVQTPEMIGNSNDPETRDRIICK